ncbi:MAG: Hpt domain-containing protein [Treponema sp.]|nr:Hpt domain-containing protein [Treponema sp.]
MADNVVYINVDEGKKRVMNNAKLYAKLLNKFKDDPNIHDIETALKAGEIENARNSAHTLKGLAANLSLTELFKQTLELETQIKAGSINMEQFAVVKETYEKTILELDKVITEYA